MPCEIVVFRYRFGVHFAGSLCLTENRNPQNTEIYVDGIATMRFQDLNSVLEVIRAEVLSRYQPVGEDTPLKALEASQIQEEDYFCQVTHRTWNSILHEIREAHKGDTDSALEGSNSLSVIKMCRGR